MLKRIFLWLVVGLSLIGCMLLNLVTSPEFMPDETSLTSTELVRIASATASGQQTQDAYPATDAIDPILQTATQLVYEVSATASQQAINATDDYWSTQGAMPTATSTPYEDPFYQTATQYIIEATASALYTPQSQRERPTNTPDNFALTATELMFEFRSGTYEAEATSGTVEARLTSTMMAWQVMITATANYWATQGVTPTFHPGYLTQVAPYITQTQAAETSIANDCDIVEHHYQRYLFYYHIRGHVEIAEDSDFPYNVFDCPDPNDQPYVPIDLYIDVIIPNDAYNEEVYEILDQALVLILDYPPENTTLGTENVSVSVFRLNRYLASQPLLRMEFAFSDLESALDEGLEGDALLEALGGVELPLP